MNFEKKVKDAVRILTSGRLFYIEQIIYDKENFGNIDVVLKSADINIRFIRDRGDVWCQLGIPDQKKEWFFLEDVLTIIGIQVEPFDNEIFEMMTKLSKIISDNIDLITQAFNKNNFYATRRKLKEMPKGRISDIFGIELKDDTKE
jgi:hypothetical protein